MLGCDPWLGRLVGWGLEAVEAVEAGTSKEMKMVDYMIRGKRKTIETNRHVDRRGKKG